MVKEKTKAGLKWKKKQWYTIKAPALFEGRVIGETLAETPEQLIGRAFAVNAMQLTGNVKKQNLALKLRVTQIEDKTGLTEIQSFLMNPNSARYLVRKGTSTIEDSFCAMTKDGKKVRIKPLAVTRAKTNSGINAHIYRVMAAALIARVHEANFENLILQVVNFDIQKDIKRMLDKVYPLKSFQIKFVGLEVNPASPLRSPAAELISQPVEEAPEESHEEVVSEDTEEEVSAEA